MSCIMYLNGQDPFVHSLQWEFYHCACDIETGRFITVTGQETGLIRNMKVDERLCLICKQVTQ